MTLEEILNVYKDHGVSVTFNFKDRFCAEVGHLRLYKNPCHKNSVHEYCEAEEMFFDKGTYPIFVDEKNKIDYANSLVRALSIFQKDSGTREQLYLEHLNRWSNENEKT